MYTGNMILFYANNNLRPVSTTLKYNITAVGALPRGAAGQELQAVASDPRGVCRRAAG